MKTSLSNQLSFIQSDSRDIDPHILTVPIAWLQTDDAVECLLGER